MSSSRPARRRALPWWAMLALVTLMATAMQLRVVHARALQDILPPTPAPQATNPPPAPAPAPAPVATTKAPVQLAVGTPKPATTPKPAATPAPAPTVDEEVDDDDETNGPEACDAHYEFWNSTSSQCTCKRDFYGMGCQMCRSAQVCQDAFLHDGGEYTCASGLTYSNASTHKTYECMLDPAIQTLFTDGALAMRCDRTTHNCTVAVYKNKTTVRGEHVVDCTVSKCDFVTGRADFKCERIDCTCGKQCSEFTKAIVEKTLSGKPAKVVVSNTTHVALEIEGSPIPLSATCRASACERIDSGGSGSGHTEPPPPPSPSIWSNGLVIALVVSGGLALVVLLGVCLCSCCVSSARRRASQLTSDEMDRAIAALASTSGHVLEFKRINCRVTDAQGATKRILQDISGFAKRGQVLGLLGPSGSGKTSLLNALAAVENGHSQLTGEVRVDGKKIARDYRRVAAYVQQDDALYATLTVRECLQYSAQLRLPSHVSDAVKYEMVSRVIAELNLGHVEHARIGTQGKTRGVSGGERRRVSIGMELVTSPQILFLDEPTSGLDSSSANAVVQLVHELASHGRIVVMSIHQPSAKAFMVLDQVMLLAKGKLLYHGPPQDAKTHFEDVGFRCPENENVADFILDIASDVENIPMVRAAFKATQPPVSTTSSEHLKPLTTPPSTLFKAHHASESSPFMSEEDMSLDTPRMLRELTIVTAGSPAPETPAAADSKKRLESPPSGSVGGSPRSPRRSSPQQPRHVPSRSSTPSRSLWIEMRVLLNRTALNIFRHRSLLLLHLALSVSLALFGGLIFNHVTNDLAGFQNRSGAFYFILTFFGFASMSSMDVFIAERSIFLRETGAMYHGAFSYFVAKAVLDTILLRILPATLFASIFYWIMGLQATLVHFMIFLVTLVLFNVAAGAISILVGVLSRNVGAANLSATVVFLIMLLFGGFLLNSQTMPRAVGWLKHFSIFSYAFEVLMTNELKGLLLKFDAPGYPSVPVYGDVFLKTLGMDYANRYYDLVALAMIAGTLNALAYLFLALQVPVRQELVEEDQPEAEDDPTRVGTKDMDDRKSTAQTDNEDDDDDDKERESDERV